MMDTVHRVSAAIRETRERYASQWDGHIEGPYIVFDWQTREIVFRGRGAACDTYLENLVADAATAALQGGSVPDGWRLVPKEPTDAMKRASRMVHAIPDGPRITMWGSNAWGAMLSAAPDPTLSKIETVASTPPSELPPSQTEETDHA